MKQTVIYRNGVLLSYGSNQDLGRHPQSFANTSTSSGRTTCHSVFFAASSHFFASPGLLKATASTQSNRFENSKSICLLLLLFSSLSLLFLVLSLLLVGHDRSCFRRCKCGRAVIAGVLYVHAHGCRGCGPVRGCGRPRLWPWL